MTAWKATKARAVLRALLRNGWQIHRTRGSHRLLRHPERGSFTFAFHDGEGLGPVMLARIARRTGLRPDDL